MKKLYVITAFIFIAQNGFSQAPDNPTGLLINKWWNASKYQDERMTENALYYFLLNRQKRELQIGQKDPRYCDWSYGVARNELIIKEQPFDPPSTYQYDRNGSQKNNLRFDLKARDERNPFEIYEYMLLRPQ